MLGTATIDGNRPRIHATNFVRKNSIRATKDIPNNELAQVLGQVKEANKALEFKKEHEVLKCYQ
jgi:hypothetical protein